MGIFVTIGSDDLLASFAAGWQMIFYTWSPDSFLKFIRNGNLMGW